MTRATLFSFLGVAALVLVFLTTQPAQAEVSNVVVSVGGLSCPFCAYGVEKKLKGVHGVKRVKVNLKSGTATLVLTDGKLPSTEEIRKAVKKAGFTPGKITLSAIGTLSHKDDRLFLKVRNAEQSFVLFKEGTKETFLDEKSRKRLADLEKKATLVAVTGAVHEHKEAPAALSTDKVEEVHSVTLSVKGMSSEKSANRLTRLLQKTKGVYRATIDFGKKTATVESIGKTLISSALISVIEDAGFKASVSKAESGQ